MRLIAAAAGLIVLTEACGPILMFSHPARESRSGIPGGKYKVVATIAAGSGGSALAVSAHVRQKLTEAGIAAVPSAGRWNTEQEACDEICRASGQPVEGVLVIDVFQLTLIDCDTRTTAYAVSGDAGGPGIDALTRRLIAYLKGGPTGPPAGKVSVSTAHFDVRP